MTARAYRSFACLGAPTNTRRGVAVVEVAITLPLLLLLLIGLLEVGRALNIQHKLSMAARAGARIYSLKTLKNESDVRAAVDQALASAQLNNYTVELDPPASDKARHLAPLAVTVSIRYEDAAWYPTPWFLKGRILRSRCVMPADMVGEPESEEDEDEEDDDEDDD
jgi:hypothetical protein